MKTETFDPSDDLRAEYDFDSLQDIARGSERERHFRTIKLAPDVAEAFPDSESVNQALRLLLKLAKSQVAGRLLVILA